MTAKTSLCELGAVELRRLIGRKAISPVELLEQCLERIATVNPALNAMVALCEDRARAEARAAEAAVLRGEALGPLHGLPVGIKDLDDTEGLRTTYGSPIFADHVPAKDERVVAAVRAAGAIVVGKTNVPEWGAGANSRNPVYGATGNPFDPMKSAAGSSGGSAAALAAGMVPIATGSDTGGSLRNPAAFCGVVGFRPSPGLVPTEKRGLGWTVISVKGPMGRTVPDTALLLSAMAGDDARDPLATVVHGERAVRPERFATPPETDLSTLRVAFSEDLGFAPTENHIRAVFRERAAAFRHLFRAAADTAPDMSGADEAFEVIRAANFLSKHLEWFRTRPQDIGPNVTANVQEGLRYSLADFARAHAEQTRLYRSAQDFFREWDVLITPGITISPRPWTELYPAEIDGKPTRTYFHWLALAYGPTLLGHPAVVVPCGLDRAGMPFGIQIVGPRGGDRFLLGVAAALERHFQGEPALRRPLPDLAALARGPKLAEISAGLLG